MPRYLLPLLGVLLTAVVGRAEVVTRTVDYSHAGTALEGLFVYDTSGPAKRPGLILAHSAGATTPVAKDRANFWAKQGYVVFSHDLYGKGLRPKDLKESAVKSGADAKERTLMRGRAEAALAQLTKQKQVDAQRVVGVGFSAGGTALLELVRGGADLEGIACYHCDLTARHPTEAKKISSAVMVLLGSDDPFVPLAQVATFEDEMRGGGVDWQIIRFGGAVHDFSNPQAGRNLKSGSAYDPDADRRATDAVKHFFTEALTPSKPTPQGKDKPAPPKGIPEKVLKVLKYVDEHQAPLAGYEGGRTFLNLEKNLPINDAQGKRIKYREWDVNPLRPGVNRGAERMVTGSDGSAYYTDDHYKSFKKIR